MAKPCRWCGQDVVFLGVRGAPRPLPFDRKTTERQFDHAHLGYIPVLRRSTGEVVMVPVNELSESRLIGTERVAMRHRCEEYREAQMRVLSLEWASDEVKRMLLTLQPRKRRR